MHTEYLRLSRDEHHYIINWKCYSKNLPWVSHWIGTLLSGEHQVFLSCSHHILRTADNSIQDDDEAMQDSENKPTINCTCY